MGKGIDIYTLDGNLIAGITRKEDAERLANWMHTTPSTPFVQLYSDKEMIYAFEDIDKELSAETILNAPWDKANRIRVGGEIGSESHNEKTAHELWTVLQSFGVVKNVG